MVRLKEYVDFITSLTEMDEVKEGKFILPTTIEFNLEMMNHRELKREVLKAKEVEIIPDELVEPFEVDILGVTLKFEHVGYNS
jgi:hypothetical protein